MRDLQQVVLRILGGNFTVFSPRFCAGLLDENSLPVDPTTKSSLELFWHQAGVRGTARPSIRALFRWLEFVLVQQMDVGLYHCVLASLLSVAGAFYTYRTSSAFRAMIRARMGHMSELEQ